MLSFFPLPSCFRPALPAEASGHRARAALFCAATLALTGACANQPETPIFENNAADSATTQTAARLDTLLPADVLLIGEQHDAPAHQHISQQVVSLLAGRALLAAVTLEMADAGASTAHLQPDATEAQTRQALSWSDKSWPWASYGPAVMSAVRAGVPVLGANLPRSQFRSSMAEQALDTRLPGPALKAQQQAIRIGHCNLLPEPQIRPMTRLQIAKDIIMADTISQAARPGKVVLLLAGNGHVDRQLGVPLHLRADLKVKAVRLQAGASADAALAQAFDSTWSTPALPDKDYCAELKKQFTRP